MDYTEFEVPASLRRHVQCVWRLRSDVVAAAAQTIYPDGRCELIVHLGMPMRRYTLAHGWQPQARCLFAAQIRAAIRLAAPGPLDCIGVRLQPAASHVIASARLPGLVDDIIDLQRLDAGFAAALQQACVQFGVDTDATPLWQLLHECIGAMPLDARVEAAVAAIDQAQGRTTIAALGRELHMSARSLQTRFLDNVGVTAKEYAQIQRLAATIRLLDRDTGPLSAVALGAGFADQAHATRELQSLVGLTPAKLRRALQAEREGDDTLRLAAAFVRGQAPL